jgi:hypothetical protein
LRPPSYGARFGKSVAAANDVCRSRPPEAQAVFLRRRHRPRRPPRMVVCSVLDFAPRHRNESRRPGRRAKIFKAGNWLKCCFEAWFSRLLKGSEPKVAPMSVSSPNVSEINRLIDDMRLLRSQMIAFDMHLKGMEAYLKASERSQRRRESNRGPWFAAAASATARTALVAVGAATGADWWRQVRGHRGDAERLLRRADAARRRWPRRTRRCRRGEKSRPRGSSISMH